MLFRSHNRLYYYRENYAGWFTLAYYNVSELCKRVNSRENYIVYPNPAHSRLYLKTQENEVTIFNSIGQIVKLTVHNEWNTEQYIALENLSNGIYFLIINKKAVRFIKY